MQLLAGQVAGDAEDDQRARLRDPRQPPVLRVAQRVDRAASATGHRGVIAPSASCRPRRAAGRCPAARSVRCRRSSGRSAAGQRLPVAGGLGGLQLAEGVRLARHRQVLGDRAGDLEERADLRAALVVLAGGVQEPRPPAERDRPAGWPRPAAGRSSATSASPNRSRYAMTAR